MVIVGRDHDVLAGIEDSPELLFPEAKRRRRNRWVMGGLVLLVLVLAGAGVLAFVTHDGSGSPSAAPRHVQGIPERSATIDGVLELQAPCRICFPRRGTVTAKEGKRTYTVSVPPNGLFRLKVPPGRYVVAGHSPQDWSFTKSGGRVESQCTTGSPTVIAESQSTVTVSVACVPRVPPGPTHVRFFPPSSTQR